MRDMKIKTEICEEKRLSRIFCGDRAGNKRALVIIPGISLFTVINPGSVNAVAAAYKGLADIFDIYLIDREKNIARGCGIEDMADSVSKVMESEGISGACVFGASQGAMIAVVLAAKYPQLVSHIALGSGAPTVDDRAKAIFERWVDYAAIGDAVRLNRDMFRHIYSKEYLDRYREELSFLETLGGRSDFDRLITLIKACDGYNAADYAGRVKCKSFVLGSDADRVFGGDASRELASLLGCECFVYGGYSHAVYDEAPDYKERLVRFFSE